MLENCEVFCNEMEKLSLPELEEKIKEFYKEFQKSNSYVDERVYFCLSHRCYLINQNFKFTPNVVKHIERINSMLIESTEKVRQRTNLLYQQMVEIKAKGDDFLDDFEVDGTVSIEFLNKDSVLILDEDENNGQSDYVSMADILDYTNIAFNPLRTFTLFDRDNVFSDTTDDNLLTEDTYYFKLNNDLLNTPELSEIENFCLASHRLFVDSHYSISDIIRIKNICNEVKVTHKNFKS